MAELTLIHEAVQERYGAIATNGGSCCGPSDCCGDSNSSNAALLYNPDLLDGFHAVPYHVMVRFGMWKELLDEPQPPTDLPVMQAMWRYGRTMALSSLGRVEESEREFKAFRDACGQVPESRTMGTNPTLAILDIGLALEPLATLGVPLKVYAVTAGLTRKSREWLGFLRSEEGLALHDPPRDVLAEGVEATQMLTAGDRHG